MFKQIQKLALGALCALTLTVAGAAPADAHELVRGRAGQVRNLTLTGNGDHAGNVSTVGTIAGEFAGLIHSVRMNHETNSLHWTLLSRDGQQEIMVAEAALDEEDAIVSQGTIARGALQGAMARARGYWQDDLFLVDLRLSLGGTEVAFTQTLEPIEEADR